MENFPESQKLYRNSYMGSYIYLFSKTHVRMYIHVRMYTYMYTYIYAYRMKVVGEVGEEDQEVVACLK